MRSLLLLCLVSLGCAPRYYCGPGTHAEGDWCVLDDASTPGDTAVDTGGGADTSDTSDSAADTSDTSDTSDSGDPPEPARVVLNEYMTSNDTKAADENGEFDDFVELYNAGGEAADLSNASLTDDTENLGQYRFPAGQVLEPGAFLTVWCDGTPEQGAFHALFTLQSAGDRVLLLQDPDGAAEVLDQVEFTDMATEVSAARIPDGGEDWVITENVTPGAANAP